MSDLKATSATTCFGHQLKVFESDYIGQQIIQHGCFERLTLDAISDLLSLIKPGCSLDIGANLGNHSVIIAQFSELLYAFEPNPVVYELLVSNLNINGFSNSEAFKIGLSNVSETSKLYLDDASNLGMASLQSDTNQTPGSSVGSVQLVRGDDFVSEKLRGSHPKKIDFIKMDIEGHEVEAIQGLAKTIKENKPLIFMEWNSDKVKQGFNQEKIFENLFSDYHIYGLSHNLDVKVYRSKPLGLLRRAFKKLVTKKRWSFVPFYQNRNYKNIALVPKRFEFAIDAFGVTQ